MDSFFPRFKNLLVLIALLLLQAVGLAIQVRRPVESGAADSPQITVARSWMVAVVSPAGRLFRSTGQAVRSTWSNYVNLRHVRQHNADLEYQIGQLRLEQAAVAEDAIQGHRLQALLAFQQHYIASTVAAQVIGTSGTDLSRVVYIDKGSADGLRPDQAVITPDGVVGKVRDVFPTTAPHTAQVLLINDQTSGAGVLLATTRIRGIIHGTSSGNVQIGNLTADERIKPGEQVLTSGGDLIYPRGLPVGVIEAIAPDPDHQPYLAIRIKPAVNLFQLEEVLVITGTQPTLPPETLKNLAKGAALTAEARAAAEKAAAEARAAAEAEAAEKAARSAAEIVADRLPSLRDPNAPAVAAAGAAADSKDPKNAGGVVPRPAPTVRPDRYSPGAAPPASTLRPGGANSDTGVTPAGPTERPRRQVPAGPSVPAPAAEPQEEPRP